MLGVTTPGHATASSAEGGDTSIMFALTAPGGGPAPSQGPRAAVVPLGRLGWCGRALGAGGIHWDWLLGRDNTVLESWVTLRVLERARGYTGRHWSILESRGLGSTGSNSGKEQEKRAKTGHKWARNGEKNNQKEKLPK